MKLFQPRSSQRFLSLRRKKSSHYHKEFKVSQAKTSAFETNGRATWNGSPAGGALATLHSKAYNLASSGRAGTDGVFTLTTWRLGDGTVAGEHMRSRSNRS
jgi:hypothetical protein